MAHSKKRNSQFVFQGKDHHHDKLHEIDGSLEQSPEEKFATICALTLFEYQLRNNTDDIPRLLRSTACIRKP